VTHAIWAFAQLTPGVPQNRYSFPPKYVTEHPPEHTDVAPTAPVHVHPPDSMVHEDEQPSPLDKFPSSQFSLGDLTPFPQVGGPSHT
jgi:hypothetical protein